MLQLFTKQKYGVAILLDKWRMHTKVENTNKARKWWKQVQNVDVVE